MPHGGPRKDGHELDDTTRWLSIKKVPKARSNERYKRVDGGGGKVSIPVCVSVDSYQEGQASLLTVSLGAILRAMASLPLPGDNHNEKVIWHLFRDGVNYPAVDFPKGCALLVQGRTAAIEIRSISLKMVDWGRKSFVFFSLLSS